MCQKCLKVQVIRLVFVFVFGRIFFTQMASGYLLQSGIKGKIASVQASKSPNLIKQLGMFCYSSFEGCCVTSHAERLWHVLV